MDIAPETDLAPAAWLRGRWTARGGRVGAVVPDGYPTYVEVLYGEHALRAVLDAVATVTPLRARCWFAVWPGWGVPRSCDVLARSFATPDQHRVLLATDLGSVPQLAHDLWFADHVERYHGEPLIERWRASGPDDMPDCSRHPDLWWPDVRRWVVGSDLDSEAAYVGCEPGVAAVLLADRRVAARRVSLDDELAPEP